MATSTPIIKVVSTTRDGVRTGTPGVQAGVFLDRDGVVNAMDRFVNTPEDFDALAIPASIQALARLTRETDLPVILVTNQGGVGKGSMSEEVNRAILERVAERVEEAGGRMDALYWCPNRPGFQVPDGEVDGRKPEAGMLVQAARDFGPEIDLTDSYMIGDMTTDIAAGENAHPGVTTILVLTGKAGQDGKVEITPDHVSRDLADAVDWIITREKSRS
ncbi:MAG: HAD-IIIA family hydrolase [Candidatus Eremiobacterota bacterium]